MSTVVFLGPTLARDEAEAVHPAVYLPPASRGDVYAAAQARPRAIGLIDGFFHSVPSVLHKEILWAMARGIHVYGASSMGALRAAELAAFGMVGVGRVFEAFRDGALTDDDEVAMVHGSRDTGYVRGSEAMVNIRATLARAVECGVIDQTVHARLAALAKALFYPERTYARLLDRGLEAGMAREPLERLRAWLPSGAVDVKRADAIEMLLRIAADLERSSEPKQVSYRFHSTTIWEQHCNGFDGRGAADAPGAEEALGDELLDELRLQGQAYASEREQALIRVLTTELALRQAETLGPAATGDLVAAARRDHDVEDEDSLNIWLDRNRLTREAFASLMHDEAQVRSMRARYQSWIPRYLYDSLRLSGRYPRLELRAREKQRLLARWGLSSPALADAGMSEPDLWTWFFGTVLDRPVPEDLDAYAAAQDYADLDLMRRAALRELLYRRKSLPRLETARPDLVSHG